MADASRRLPEPVPTTPTARAAQRRPALYADALPPRPLAVHRPRWPTLRWLRGQLIVLAAIAAPIAALSWWIWR